MQDNLLLRKRENEVAHRINQALNFTLAQTDQCTADLGGKANTHEFTLNVISNLNRI